MGFLEGIWLYNAFIFIVIGYLLLLLLATKYRNRQITKQGLGVPGRTIWLDKGRSTPAFYNRQYGIAGKPDSIQEVNGEMVAVEYKSRKGRVFASDIQQLVASTLAARSKYPIKKGIVKTATQSEVIDLSGSDAQLFRNIESSYNKVIALQQGNSGCPDPHYIKCRACGYSSQCKHSAA